MVWINFDLIRLRSGIIMHRTCVVIIFVVFFVVVVAAAAAVVEGISEQQPKV